MDAYPRLLKSASMTYFHAIYACLRRSDAKKSKEELRQALAEYKLLYYVALAGKRDMQLLLDWLAKEGGHKLP